jgi:hypothetical protein
MRKLVVLSVVAMVFLALGAGVALADDARIQCKSVPCYASGDDDLVLERKGNGKQDEIILRGGNDLVRANRYTRGAVPECVETAASSRAAKGV